MLLSSNLMSVLLSDLMWVLLSGLLSVLLPELMWVQLLELLSVWVEEWALEKAIMSPTDRVSRR